MADHRACCLRRRWPAVAHQPSPADPHTRTGDADGFPAVPGADFPVFRAACRRLLDPDSFAQVDRCYCDTMRRLLAWLADHAGLLDTLHRLDQLPPRRAASWPDAAASDDPAARDRRERTRRTLARVWEQFTTQVARRLFALTATDRGPAETLVRLRAAQAAFLRYGVLLALDPAVLAMLGDGDGRATLTPRVAMRLRGCCTPRCTAAAVLVLATGADAADLARLQVGDLTADAAQVRLADRTLTVPTHARGLVRALLVERGDQHATATAPLFTDRNDGRHASDHIVRGLLQRAALQAGVAIPGAHGYRRPAAWLAEHGLTLTRLPVAPPRDALR